MNKLSSFKFDIILGTHLHGVPLFENILSKVKTQVDAQGDICDHVIDNIKTVIKVAIVQLKKRGDEVYIPKMKASLKALLEYGTADNSHRIEKFIEGFEKNNSQLISLDEIDKDYLSLFDGVDFSSDKLPSLQLVVNGVRQIEEC